MKYLVWLCVFQSTTLISNAQSSADSLRMLLWQAQARENIIDIQMYSSRLAWTFLNNTQYDSAIKYYHKSLRTISPGAESRLTGNLLYGIAAAYNSTSKFDSSIFYYKLALNKFRAANDTSNAFVVESNLAIVYKNVDLYEESLESALHVVSSLGSSDQSILLGSCYNTIGSIYFRIQNFDKALEYYRLALENRKVNNQTADVARMLNNIGELFILTHQYDSAVTNLQRAIAIKRQLDDLKGTARTLNNIGKVSMLTGDVQAAVTQFQKALEIQRDQDDAIGMIEALNNIGELNIITNQLQQAEKNLKEAEGTIRRAGSPAYLRRNLELQVRLDRERHDFAMGMLHLEQLSAIRDSLLNQEKDRSLQAMQIRYETLKKEQQIATLEQQEEINRNRIRGNQILIGTLLLGLVLVAAVGLLAYINFRNARSAKARIELLLADMRHRGRNNLQTLASIFHLQTKHYTDHNMVLEARSSESRVHAMSLLHEKFYSASPGHTIDLQTYVADLVNQLVDIYGFRARNASIAIEVDEIHLDIDKALPLSLIIQELVSNAFKYAFEDENSPKLSVSIRLHANGELVTTVSDNGVGMNVNKTRLSQGFSLVEAFVAQLDGKLQVKTVKGTTFSISFPLTPIWKRHAS